MNMNLHRRAFLRFASLAAAAGSLPRWAWSQNQALQHDPFALGVASGEPTADGMVLWTRIVQAPQTEPKSWREPFTVHWELAHDAAFRRIVQRGQAQAWPALGHGVHVELRGLQPDRWYYYRFMLGDAVSATGRTRTAPAQTQLPAALRLVFASCQRWEDGHYAAWRHVCADAPDLVLFLGDYIYENAIAAGSTGLARTHALPLARTLADYRARYALHKSDPALQAAHATCPWAVVWDDHEVQNDYAADRGSLDAPAAFVAQRNAAWQAFYENMPLRATSLLGAEFASLQVYRRLRWGRLAHLHLLDARQYRSWQACRTPGSHGAGAVRPEACPELADPQRSLLGMAQERWLDAGLAADAQHGHTQWSVIAQQTLFSPRRYPSGLQSTDTWDGYPAARTRLLRSIAEHAPRNTVLQGGDIHQNYVCRVLEDAVPSSPAAPRVLASEFCGTSISSRSGTTQARVDAVVRHNPHVLFARCEQRGYGLADITPARWTTSLRVLDDAMNADSGVTTQARFIVEDGHAGPIAT
ncbi:alkaline phosphatase D family protein [Extensimonas vulgaris]|uniref:Alkaline phosphatase D n=1 Tax=Extensimonas vulgaris TaxID=1031594 RepID=A0A369ARS5_9BURK|nr:alkaline phosphatase D family protein [Extensimonas vulgaris]RCX10917.1 alkaline phosphatase D [Extensimonas vulgaris]TWI41589.1 alkaline phosphatase D [Extensimonas vulgaris]TXD16065.1 alkaline phosphatase [Extensimonas vulgaris]